LNNKSRKIFVIGLDGATFDIIGPLMKKGKLHNIAKIMKQGVYGPLKSTIHPITPAAWSTFLTGKNAGKHGIYDFTSRRNDSYGIQFINASTRRGESIFSMLSRAGRRVGAIAIPFTFPPERVNGFMLSGIDSPGEDVRSVYPDTIFDEIKTEFGHYHIHLASPVGRKIDNKKFWRDIRTEDENRTAISQYLMKKHPCDLFMTVYNNIDRVQHQHLDEMVYNRIQNDNDIGDEDLLVKTYEHADSQVGSLLSGINEDDYVILMSDHGAGPIKGIFFLNRWLEENGYLTYEKEKKDHFLKTVQRSRFLAKRFLPRGVKNLMKSRMGSFRNRVDSLLSFSKIDWEKTRAYGFGMFGNIFINLKGREPEGTVEPGKEFEDLRSEIIERLSQLRDPETAHLIIDKVYRREEVYHGPCVENAPDLLIHWKNYAYYTSVTLGKEEGPIFGPCENIDASEYKHVGTHRLNGVFMAMGNKIHQGTQITTAEIADIPPTILYMLDQPIPEDMDGRVLTEIFEEAFIRDYPPRYETIRYDTEIKEVVTYSNKESEEIADRLRALGYIE
jgi:predicted AlkP superfamily phosphohydrolase/phosphomutase